MKGIQVTPAWRDPQNKHDVHFQYTEQQETVICLDTEELRDLAQAITVRLMEIPTRSE